MASETLSRADRPTDRLVGWPSHLMHLSSSARNKYNPGSTETDPAAALCCLGLGGTRRRRRARTNANLGQQSTSTLAGSGADPWRDLIKFALTAKGSRRARAREQPSQGEQCIKHTHSALSLGPVAITCLRCGRKSLCGSATPHTYSGRYYAVLWVSNVLWIAAAACDDHTCLAPAGQGSARERSEKRAQRCTCTRPLMAFRATVAQLSLAAACQVTACALKEIILITSFSCLLYSPLFGFYYVLVS